jgi:hypothetical protein
LGFFLSEQARRHAGTPGFLAEGIQVGLGFGERLASLVQLLLRFVAVLLQLKVVKIVATRTSTALIFATAVDQHPLIQVANTVLVQLNAALRAL